MVKGISRRVVVVDSPDRRFFEQAIFIVRNDAAGEGVTARFPWGVSGIRCEKGGGRPVLVSPWPNTNLLAPFTRIPIIRWRLEPGTHRLTTLVTGSLPGA